MPFPLVIHGGISSLGHLSKKEKRHSQGVLILPNTFPREESAIMRYKDIIERSNVEHLSVRRGSTKLIFTSPSQYNEVQQIKN
jgi:hypothetical protein